MLLSHEAFLTALKGLFEATQASGSVFITQKRVVPRATAKSEAAGASFKPYVLYRATDGKRKLSTQVTADDAARFHPLYMSIIKGSMGALKKIDKKKEAASAKKVAGGAKKVAT